MYLNSLFGIVSKVKAIQPEVKWDKEEPVVDGQHNHDVTGEVGGVTPS